MVNTMVNTATPNSPSCLESIPDIRQDSTSIVSDSAPLPLGQDERQSRAATADIRQSGEELNPDEPRDPEAEGAQPSGLEPGAEDVRDDISTSRGTLDERGGRLSS